MVLVNTQTRAIALDVDVVGLVPSEMRFEGDWNRGRYAVTRQPLHGLTIPARDTVVLASIEDGAVG